MKTLSPWGTIGTALKSYSRYPKLKYRKLNWVNPLRKLFIREQFNNPHFYFMFLADTAVFVFAHLLAYLIRFELILDATRVDQILYFLPYIVFLNS